VNGGPGRRQGQAFPRPRESDGEADGGKTWAYKGFRRSREVAHESPNVADSLVGSSLPVALRPLQQRADRGAYRGGHLARPLPSQIPFRDKNHRSRPSSMLPSFRTTTMNRGSAT